MRLARAADTTAAVRLVTDSERRARLALRQRLAPGAKTADTLAAADGVVCLHATDPATIALSAWARVERFAAADLERALYEERSLVKHLAMRRTLFVFPRATLAAAQAAASDRVAATERRKLIADVERAGLHADGAAWLDAACDAVRAALADGRTETMSELRDELPLLAGAIEYGHSTSWAGRMPLGPRVLTVLSAQGEIVRATNAGGWSVSRPRWAATERWLGEPIGRISFADGTAELVRRWLRAFGPGSEADVKWWLGSTLRAVRGALADLEAVEVELERGGRGWLLPDDLDPVEAPDPWAALLPPLDPTTMGWQERAFYLGELQTAAVRHGRQRRRDGVVGRPHRRRLAPARRRLGRAAVPRGSRRRRPRRARRRGGAAHRLVRRRARARPLSVAAVEAARGEARRRALRPPAAAPPAPRRAAPAAAARAGAGRPCSASRRRPRAPHARRPAVGRRRRRAAA